MFDLNLLISNPKVDIQYFTAVGPPAGASVASTLFAGTCQVWQKPKGKSFAYIFAVGGGSGGRQGNTGPTLIAGGGGGAPGMMSSTMYFLRTLPDCLFIKVGTGGAGGTGGVAPISGNSSIVSVFPNAAAGATYLLNFAPGGQAPVGNTAGGLAATTTSPGSAQIAQAMAFNCIGVGTAVSQHAAVAPTANSNGGTGNTAAGNNVSTAVIWQSGYRFSPGAAGAGFLGTLNAAGLAGGSTIGGALLFPDNPGGAGGAAGNNPGQAGANGFQVANLFYFYGGSGGGSGGTGATATTAAAGGAGGAGGPGCGGGGGGSGFTGSEIAPGGKGGDGFVIIASW